MLTPAQPAATGAVDLSSCDREPIHYIGVVQPHGALLAAERGTDRIRCASANLAEFTGFEPQAVLGRTLEEMLGSDNWQALHARRLAPMQPDLLKPCFLDLPQPAGGSRHVECYPHVHDGHLQIEFVAPQAAPATVWEEDLLRQRIIGAMIKADTVTGLADVGARIIREITGFDRVMIYRFAEDLHGEVIAESTARSDSFLGQHYPAADIPEPARRHFLLNLIRAIPDINAVPVPILSKDGDIADARSPRPLDLTYSKLRGVAPVHVEYLNNMGVRGSMSISLTSNDALWGLVACHHYAPLHVPFSTMRFAELLGGTISAMLQSLENSTLLKRSIRVERLAFEIEQDTRAGRPLREVIRAFAPPMLGLFKAQGLHARLDGHTIEHGVTPQPALPGARLASGVNDGVATCDHLQSLMPLDESQWRIAAGAAYLELSEDGADYLVLYREHFEQTIKWAGRPDKIEQRMDDGVVRLSPRGSFEMWREERRGRSRPFDGGDREALRILRRALFALNSLDRERKAIQAQKQAEREEARLRMAMLDTLRRSAMGELAAALAHELNQPLFAVSNYVNACRQELLNFDIAIPPRVGELIDDAASEATRAGELVRRLRNFFARGELSPEQSDLNTVVRQGVALAIASSAEPEPQIDWQLAPAMPLLPLDPVQIAQVVLNLTRNALAAMRAAETRTLTVTTQQFAERVEVAMSDTGVGIGPDLGKHLFEPFHNSTTSGMGIGLSLCRSIVEAHRGRIWFEPRAHGTKVVFSLPAG